MARQLLFSLPQTVTELEQFLQRGTQAREEGHYAKSLELLERGWNFLQQWGVESAEMCFQLGVVWAHFGRFEEAVTRVRRGLQHSSSELSLKLSRGLVEVYYQTGEWK